MTLVLLTLAVCAGADPAEAQARLRVTEVREIADAALELLLPPDQILSGLSVAERKIFFDHRRTLAEFGHDRAGLPRLQLTRHVEDAVAGILEDCHGMGSAPCAQLGRGVYVSMKPVFQQTTSEVAVWVHVLWPSRLDTPDFGERTIRVGFSSELFFNCNPAGRWEYVRTGATLAY